MAIMNSRRVAYLCLELSSLTAGLQPTGGDKLSRRCANCFTAQGMPGLQSPPTSWGTEFIEMIAIEVVVKMVSKPEMTKNRIDN
jgi:hypothetical protein